MSNDASNCAALQAALARITLVLATPEKSPSTRLVWIALEIMRADFGPTFHVTHAVLAKLTGLDDDIVRKCLYRLRDAYGFGVEGSKRRLGTLITVPEHWANHGNKQPQQWKNHGDKQWPNHGDNGAGQWANHGDNGRLACVDSDSDSVQSLESKERKDKRSSLRSDSRSRAVRDGEPLRFDEFYNRYPRKKARAKAAVAFAKALRSATAEEIIAGLENQLEEFSHKEQRYIPYPASWLNAKGWLDEPEQQSNLRLFRRVSTDEQLRRELDEWLDSLPDEALERRATA